MPNQFRSMRNQCQGTKLIKLRRFAKRRNRSTLQAFLSGNLTFNRRAWPQGLCPPFPKPFRNNALFATLATAHNASCATLSRTVALLRRARTKGDPHEEHSAAADQRYVRLRQGRAFRHAAGAVAYGLPHPQPADGAGVRYAQLSQVLHPRHHRVRAPEPRHLGGARL